MEMANERAFVSAKNQQLTQFSLSGNFVMKFALELFFVFPFEKFNYKIFKRSGKKLLSSSPGWSASLI